MKEERGILTLSWLICGIRFSYPLPCKWITYLYAQPIPGSNSKPGLGKWVYGDYWVSNLWLSPESVLMVILLWAWMPGLSALGQLTWYFLIEFFSNQLQTCPLITMMWSLTQALVTHCLRGSVMWQAQLTLRWGDYRGRPHLIIKTPFERRLFSIQ